MKPITNLKTILVIISLLYLFSCEKHSEQNFADIRQQSLIIDKENVPDTDFYQFIGFDEFIIDEERDILLDKENSILYIPYNDSYSVFDNTNKRINIVIRVCLRIARRNNKEMGSCTGDCKCGLGFRCGFITCQQLRTNAYNSNKSRDRWQPADVEIDENSNLINIAFINDIDWDYLQNN